MDFQQIYNHHASEYDALVRAEDCEHQLLPAIEEIASLADTAVLEVGVGTGRIARQVLGRARRLVGVDRSAAMLAVAREHLARFPAEAWALHCAEAEALPVPSGWADVAIAGWVFGHLRSWLPESWPGHIGAALGEMERALRPGGALIVIETLGTGHTTPRAPTPQLAEYFAWLEHEHGMGRKAIRTDYLFSDVKTAARTTGFFFGEAFAGTVMREGWHRVPECTGLWWKRV